MSTADVEAAKLLLDLNASLGVTSDPAIHLLAAASSEAEMVAAPARSSVDQAAEQGPTSSADRLAALFDRYRAGDDEAIGPLVRLATPVMWHVIRATRADPVTAEDVLQRVWLTFVVEAEEIGSSTDLLSWLVVRARREAQRESTRASRTAATSTSASDEVEQTLKGALRGLVAYSSTSPVPV